MADSGKDMKDVIAQFQKANKGNINLRPVAGAKPKPGQKSSVNEQTDTGNDTAKQPRRQTSDHHESAGSPATHDAANAFKVALKPVARPSGTGVAARNCANQKSATDGDKPVVTSHKDDASETTTKASTSMIANKSKMFENQQKQPEAVTPSTPTAGVGAVSMKPKFPVNANALKSPVNSNPLNSPVNSNALKSPVVPKPQPKPAQATEAVQKPNGTAATSANKWKKVESNPDELKPTDQKSDFKKEFPFRKGVKDEESNKEDDQAGNTNFATIRPMKTTTKPTVPTASNTLPKQPKSTVAPKTNKAAKEPEPETDDDDQPKIPPKPSAKAEQPKIPAKLIDDPVQPKIPPRSSEPKIPAKTTEDIDQPKVPLRREQKKSEETAGDKTASKNPPPANRKVEEPKKGSDVYDQNANKVKSAESLLRNMGRPLPKPAGKQYRLIPVPKQKGKPPRKTAKPPIVDLTKYATYATSKSVQPAADQVPEEAYDDGDDLYEDCDNMVVVSRKSARISEYTEEEEAKTEMSAKVKQPTTNTDNYGKMFNTPSIDEYDDDEIYQEID